VRIAAALALLLLLRAPSCAEHLRFYGDLMLSRGIEHFAADLGEKPIRHALSLFAAQNAMQIVNLEGSVGDATECSPGQPLCFSIVPGRMELVRGFFVVSLENNHSLDTGPAGLGRTVQTLRTMNIIPLSGKDNATVIVTDNGNVGIIAATDVLNNPADSANVRSAGSPEIQKEIRRLKETCTAVVVYVHWGRELLPVATERMKQLAAAYVDAGADVIVGTHPHVVGPVTAIHRKPVIFSLGNFLFDQKYADTKRGAIVDLEIEDNGLLRCELSACETPVNSYLPYPAARIRFHAENEMLDSCSRTVRRIWTGTFTKDKRDKCLILDSMKGQKGLWHMELYDSATKTLEGKTPPMPIRKLQPVDLNGDGICEVMLIQSIYSSFDNETAKRVYIYSFASGFHAVWRGTALSRPLLDAVFVAVERGRPLLAALHSADSFLLRDPKCKGRVVTVYRWNGFGFDGIKEMKVESECDGISCVSGEVRLTKRGFIKGVISSKQLGAGGTIRPYDYTVLHEDLEDTPASAESGACSVNKRPAVLSR
jgi:Bacterial capsule synthesis protein PGA_cap